MFVVGRCRDIANLPLSSELFRLLACCLLAVFLKNKHFGFSVLSFSAILKILQNMFETRILIRRIYT